MKLTILIIIVITCTSVFGYETSNKKGNTSQIQNEQIQDKGIKLGIPAYGRVTVNRKCKGGYMLRIKLEEPVTLGIAAKPEKWGYFQFPSIDKKTSNTIIAKWRMNADAIEAYGSHKFEAVSSMDLGKTWNPAQPETAGGTLLANGDRIEILTPKPVKTTDIKLPEPIGAGLDTYAILPYTFYRLHELPENCQGILINRLKKGETEWKSERAALNDPQAARYSFKGLFPIVWWGDMHVLPDGSIIAGVYPGFYVADDGKADPKSGVFFYHSTDGGCSWNIQGRIRYIPDLSADPKGIQRMGFTEPAFEILSDGTFLCIMRTTDGQGIGPMYASRSANSGHTWTKPEVITPSGVLPRLLRLENDVVVLASGRPGVQVRFSTNGNSWTDPFEMLPYVNEDDQVSCGYTGLLPIGKNRFLIIYSDFRYKNEENEFRKAIKVREIEVKKR